MGRTKIGSNKSLSVNEKYEVIKPIVEGKKSSSEVTRKTGLSNGMISNWIKKYRENRIKGLENKRKLGNPLMKYSFKI